MEIVNITGVDVLVLVLLVGFLLRRARTRKEAAKAADTSVVAVQEVGGVVFFDAPALEEPEADAEDTLPFIRLPFFQEEKPTTEFVAHAD